MTSQPDWRCCGTCSTIPNRILKSSARPPAVSEAVESINQLAPDLVFLDVQMPGLDGFEVVAQIKLPRMPIIIFVTGRDDFALKAFEAHALDYLVKPCQTGAPALGGATGPATDSKPPER